MAACFAPSFSTSVRSRSSSSSLQLGRFVCGTTAIAVGCGISVVSGSGGGGGGGCGVTSIDQLVEISPSSTCSFQLGRFLCGTTEVDCGTSDWRGAGGRGVTSTEQLVEISPSSSLVEISPSSSLVKISPSSSSLAQRDRFPMRYWGRVCAHVRHASVRLCGDQSPISCPARAPPGEWSWRVWTAEFSDEVP